jgi:hypothetical protein
MQQSAQVTRSKRRGTAFATTYNHTGPSLVFLLGRDQKPCTEICLYKGDGLIAVWSWVSAIKGDNILKTVDAIFNVIKRKQPAYERLFGVVPNFRRYPRWRRGGERATRYKAFNRHLP